MATLTREAVRELKLRFFKAKCVPLLTIGKQCWLRSRFALLLAKQWHTEFPDTLTLARGHAWRSKSMLTASVSMAPELGQARRFAPARDLVRRPTDSTRSGERSEATCARQPPP